MASDHGHSHPHSDSLPTDDELNRWIREKRQALSVKEPEKLAKLAGLDFNAKESTFEVRILGYPYVVTFPGLVAREEATEHHEGAPWLQSLMLLYLSNADGTSLSREWVAFRQLPGGRLYQQAFERDTEDKLTETFDNNLESFRTACKRHRGVPEEIGDAAYTFFALPRVALRISYWLGDEDFPPKAQVLFDAADIHYLPTDALAVLAGRLTNMLIRASHNIYGMANP